MPGQPVKIGPFTGGLNNVSLAGESKDTEVTELVNFELALDTSLVSRPPIEIVAGTTSTQPNHWDVLGVFRITAASWYVIVNVPTGATTFDIRAYPLGDFTQAPVAIKTTTGLMNRVVSFVQYNDWCYFNVADGATDTGFRWKIGTLTAIATMPKGQVMISWEDRLWITGSGVAATGNYVWFSTVDATGPKPDTWNTSVDFFNADPGSGGLNTALLALTNSLLIFKEDATYRFSFPSSPKNGDLSNMSRMVGAANKNSVIGFESYAFIYDQGRVYELINTKFSQINLNVDFRNGVGSSALASGVDLSVVNRRLIVRYFNTMFVYGVDTRTWSQWQSSNGTPGKFYELPTDSSSAVPGSYLAASRGAVPGTVRLLKLVDEYSNRPAVETIECWVKTKAYDYQANSVFKRLFLWGLDVKTTRTIEMTAIPLGKKQSVTWDQLESYTWDQLEAGTYDNPLSFLNVSNTVIDITSDVVDVSENGRFFVKAPKSLRFRQIQFAVKLSTLGNAETGPVKLFSITSYTKASQLVVDKAT